MSFRLAYRRYRLPLRAAVRTAHEVWKEREGILIRLEDETGAVGHGEVAPIPAFGTETVTDAAAALQTLGEKPGFQAIAAVPRNLGCLRSGLRQALSAMEAPDDSRPVVETKSDYRGVAALLPAGRAAREQIEPKAEAGFRVFKWKVGVDHVADELALLDDLCALLPSGAKLRLDANGAWDRRTAERWLERCAERPIEFVEQPCFARKGEGEAAVRRAQDALLGLAADYPTPLALDESLIGEGDVEHWLTVGWPGWYVVKPTLMGDLNGAMQRLAKAKATVVFSSALETNVGARTALQAAFAWSGEAKALGFGVWPLFVDPRFEGPTAAPFIRREDIIRIDPEATWTALS